MGFVEAILDDGIEGACIILLLVVSYKIYRLKIDINKDSMEIFCPGGGLHNIPGGNNYNNNNNNNNRLTTRNSRFRGRNSSRNDNRTRPFESNSDIEENDEENV